jgi:adenylyltransferase/sulfurtransferase
LVLLKQAGFADAKHVQGGITAWATQVDKTQPVY